MTRNILVHLNVEASDTDTRSADEIANALVSSFAQIGMDIYRTPLGNLTIVAPLAEEV
jgi:capsular polysaccharide biosynthesis protein